jgi:hypothetical protein
MYSVNPYSAVMARAQHVIAVSDTVRDYVLANFPVTPERISVIQRGVDVDSFHQHSLSPDWLSAFHRDQPQLVEALHPTPAVCGLPGDEALAFLREEEPFERGWYAGPVGWFDARGDGVFAPALRTAVAHGRSWRLFAGAGIVEGSRPDAEWEETRIKLEPVLRALEVVAEGGAGGGRAGGAG